VNHERNRQYFLQKELSGGVLDMPVLFVEAAFDRVCDTADSSLAADMKQSCKDLTYVSIESGHWVALEKPEQVNDALEQWIREKTSDWLPSDVQD
jgi:soluble epoxide hydrolase/lipid-phosphate phosphatase